MIRVYLMKSFFPRNYFAVLIVVKTLERGIIKM